MNGSAISFDKFSVQCLNGRVERLSVDKAGDLDFRSGDQSDSNVRCGQCFEHARSNAGMNAHTDSTLSLSLLNVCKS